MTPFAKTPNDLWTRLYYFYFLCLIATVSFIISSALFLQFMYHEIPCPLCLLQRVGYLGICFGIILTLRAGFQPRHMGFSMLFTLFLLVVSERQSLIDIVPRPGHHWIGSAIMGIQQLSYLLLPITTRLTRYRCLLSNFLRCAPPVAL